MGQKIDDQDYEEYKVKVPKHDKDGNDITGDKLGKGGRHRDDGTFSGMAYDFQPLEESDNGKTREDVESELEMLAYEEKISEIQEEWSAFDTISACATKCEISFCRLCNLLSIRFLSPDSSGDLLILSGVSDRLNRSRDRRATFTCSR